MAFRMLLAGQHGHWNRRTVGYLAVDYSFIKHTPAIATESF
jgi:hypothetical protein